MASRDEYERLYAKAAPLFEECAEFLYQMEHSEGVLNKSCERVLNRILVETEKLVLATKES